MLWIWDQEKEKWLTTGNMCMENFNVMGAIVKIDVYTSQEGIRIFKLQERLGYMDATAKCVRYFNHWEEIQEKDIPREKRDWERWDEEKLDWVPERRRDIKIGDIIRWISPRINTTVYIVTETDFDGGCYNFRPEDYRNVLPGMVRHQELVEQTVERWEYTRTGGHYALVKIVDLSAGDIIRFDKDKTPVRLDSRYKWGTTNNSWKWAWDTSPVMPNVVVEAEKINQASKIVFRGDRRKFKEMGNFMTIQTDREYMDVWNLQLQRWIPISVQTLKVGDVIKVGCYVMTPPLNGYGIVIGPLPVVFSGELKQDGRHSKELASIRVQVFMEGGYDWKTGEMKVTN